MKRIFCLSLYFKIRKFIFRQSESCVLTMSSWWRRVKICGLKSSIEVQLPTGSGNLKKVLYSCLCTCFMSCYCVLTEKIDENGSVVTITHFSRLRVGSLLIPFGDSNVWPGSCKPLWITPTTPSLVTDWYVGLKCTKTRWQDTCKTPQQLLYLSTITKEDCILDQRSLPLVLNK